MPNTTTRLDRLCLALTGQDALVVYHQLQAIFYNLVTWLLVVLGWRKASDSLVPVAAILPPAREPNNDAVAAVVLSPGGLERLSLEMLGDKVVTVGYNVLECNRVPGCNSLAIVEDGPLPDGLAIVRITSCSVNYADITIRWGLYESAIRYVGYPIVPGFDFAGIVERVGRNAGVEVGDDVFGITFFGAYSSRVLVPGSQCRARPQKALTPDEAAALPSVAGTALHSLKLAGFWPAPPVTNNRAVLVHSAAGGVGSMLVQMAKILGCSPVVAVVGSSHKVSACEALGADVVIDKSTLGSAGLWAAAAAAAPKGYAAIFDANGVATLRESYDHLAQTGTLVICDCRELTTLLISNPRLLVCPLPSLHLSLPPCLPP
jgi:NADPH:quinone reductase-like Zn-dependent oxidoreductase